MRNISALYIKPKVYIYIHPRYFRPCVQQLRPSGLIIITAKRILCRLYPAINADPHPQRDNDGCGCMMGRKGAKRKRKKERKGKCVAVTRRPRAPCAASFSSGNVHYALSWLTHKMVKVHPLYLRIYALCTLNSLYPKS